MIDKTTPRHVVYSSFKDKPGACPRCSGELVNEYQTYAVETRQGERIADSFIISGNFGWFCKSCPILVINKGEVKKMLSFQKRGWRIGSEDLVLGIVDLDAIPASKRHLPIGDPNNPLPLIIFIDSSQSDKLSGSSSRRKRKRR